MFADLDQIDAGERAGKTLSKDVGNTSVEFAFPAADAGDIVEITFPAVAASFAYTLEGTDAPDPAEKDVVHQGGQAVCTTAAAVVKRHVLSGAATTSVKVRGSVVGPNVVSVTLIQSRRMFN